MDLPIQSIKNEFLQQLQSHHLVISAATGSGKSTCLPVWAAQQGKVLVIEPRRIACTSLAQYVAQLSGSELGDEIGYAIRFEGKYTENSNVVFVTPGVALRWFFENKLTDFKIVILDEFHERRWDMDLILALLKEYDKHRLIVTSATLTTQKLAQYLPANMLHSEGKMYPVTETFITSDSRQMPSKQSLTDSLVQACEHALANTLGDILVFLPGKGEIATCASRLKYLNALVITLYSGCSKQQQQLALSQQHQQRIILATNVAETSLTIPNVTCVIDSGLERRTHLRNGKTVLNLEAISKDSAKQRLGRAGRTQAGLCVRLYGKHAPLIEHTPPEIQRENLTELVLGAACASQGVDSLTFLEPLPEQSKKNALSLLQKIGAIDSHQQITPLGQQLYPLPIDPELAYLITQMPSKPLMQAMIDLTAIIAVPARVYQLPTDPYSIEALNTQFNQLCDVELAIAALRAPISELSYDKEALTEAKQFSEQLRIIFDLPQLKYAASYARDDLLKAIATTCPEWVFINKHNRRGAFGNGHSEVSVAKDSRVSSDAQGLIVLSTFAQAGKGTKQALTLATLNAPISQKTIAELNLGEIHASEPRLENHEIVICSKQLYAGVVIAQNQQRAQGKLLIPACIELILNNQLFCPAGTRITTAIRYHHLYEQQQGLNSEILTAQAFIEHKLYELGITEQEDLQLIEPGDLHYNALEEWQITPFMQAHPIVINLPELTLEVEYHFNAKRITLHYQQGSRKDAPKRWELPSWSGFSIRYKKASKVVKVN